MTQLGIEIDMLSLGNADCILVSRWENGVPTRILIDGGNKGNATDVRTFQLGISYLDHVVCTHPHDDHAGGLTVLLADPTLRVGRLWSHIPGCHVDTTALSRVLQAKSESSVIRVLRESLVTQRSLLDLAQRRGIPVQEPFQGASIGFLTVCSPDLEFYRDTLCCFSDLEKLRLYEERLGAMELRSIIDEALEGEPGLIDDPVTSAENESSVVLATVFNGELLLFTADAGVQALGRARDAYKFGPCRWMQIPHHGSRRNLNRKLIEYFRPQVACVSVEGSKKHPRRAVVNAFKDLGTAVFSTHYPSPAHLWFHLGYVPVRSGYSPATSLWN
jgi:beta-lactamase superfamily II metal-dependent hydrolase